MKIEAFHDPRTATLTYLAFDPCERVGVLIDPVLDFDAASGRRSTCSAEPIARFLEREEIELAYVLDTHAHADHVTAMPFFRDRFDAQTGIGREIVAVQRAFAQVFDLEERLATDGRQFDQLLGDGDQLDCGPFQIDAIHTPGHTPACMTYRIGDALFVGDTLFQPDYGTARCDFPGGSAGQLWDSIQRLYGELPPTTRVFTCHDYQPGGRALAYESTLGEQRRENVQIQESVERQDFIRFRLERDLALDMPSLMLPAIQVNIQAGEWPDSDAKGRTFLKLPIDAFAIGDGPDR